MSLFYIDNFDNGLHAWQVSDGEWVGTYVHNGVKSLHLSSNGVATRAQAGSAIYGYMMVYFTSISNSTVAGSGLVGCMRGASPQCGIGVGPFRKLCAYSENDLNPSNSGILATSAESLVEDTWQCIGFYLLPDPIAGVIEVYLNGIRVIRYVGNTANQGVAGMDSIFLGEATSQQFYIDSVTLDDGQVPDELTILTIAPNTDAGPNELTSSTGDPDHYTDIDDVPLDTTDYLYTEDADDEEMFTKSNPSISGVIKALQVNAVARRDAGAPENLQLQVRSGGNDYQSGDKAITTTVPAMASHLWVTDPDGGAWGNLQTKSFGFITKA